MKTSLIITVLNEEKTIEALIKSIKNQIKKPDEIVIADGGSTDATVSILKKELPSVKIIEKKGNRSVGRNAAIESAQGAIILVTDAGCTLDRRWVSAITAPFRKRNVDVVSGFYRPIASSVFQKCLATYTCVMSDKLDDSFLPSSRSVAFLKKSWIVAGKYPESLSTCEDLVFARSMKLKKLHFELAKNAVVYWQQRKNILEAFVQFFTYAKGDGEAFYIRPNTPLLFIRYGFVIVLLATCALFQSVLLASGIVGFFVAYVIWSIQKNYRYVKSRQALFYLPLLQFASDIAVLLGMIVGFSSRVRHAIISRK